MTAGCRCIYRTPCPKHGDAVDLAARLAEIIELCDRVDAGGGGGYVRTDAIRELAGGAQPGPLAADPEDVDDEREEREDLDSREQDQRRPDGCLCTYLPGPNHGTRIGRAAKIGMCPIYGH